MSGSQHIEFGTGSQRIFKSFEEDQELKRLRAFARVAVMTEILDVTSGKEYALALSQKDWSSMAQTASSYSEAIRKRIARLICEGYYGPFTHDEQLFWQKYWDMMVAGLKGAGGGVGCYPQF